MNAEGKCIIVSAPSGAGKTTIVKHLLQSEPALVFSVSACSRPMRDGEKDGTDYYFLSPEDFRSKIQAGEFIEWEEVYPESFYGTLRSEIDRIWDMGNHVIFDVDVFGGINLKRIFGARALSVFIMPPSPGVLEERLRKRSTDSEDSLRKRIDKARLEMEQHTWFDRVIVNDDLETALEQTAVLVKTFLHTNPTTR